MKRFVTGKTGLLYGNYNYLNTNIMKKLILFFAALFVFGNSFAQTTIPNGGFETWGGNGLFTQEQPNNWTAALEGTVTIYGSYGLPVHFYFGTKSSDAHSGNYALKLVSQSIGITGMPSSYQFPGIAQIGNAEGFSIPMSTLTNLAGLISNIGNGQLDSIPFSMEDLQSLSSLTELMASGIAFTTTPAHLNLWVKYLPQGNDQMRVIAYTRNGQVPVGYGTYTSEGAMPDYTQIRVSFSNALEACDSLSIIILTGGLSPDPATELYIDDVTVDFTPDGITETSESAFSVYPTPADGIVTITTGNDRPYQYQLFDLTGKSMSECHQASGINTLDVSHLSSGLYLLRISQSEGSVTKKIIVR